MANNFLLLKQVHDGEACVPEMRTVPNSLSEALLVTLRTLPSSNSIRVTFQNSPDMCLLDSLWSQGFGVQVASPDTWLQQLQVLNYNDQSQHIIIGDLQFLIEYVSKASQSYASLEKGVNALKTHFIWVVVEASNVSTSSNGETEFTGILQSVSDVLLEGMKCVLLYQSMGTKNSVVKLGSVEAPGDGSWILKMAGTWQNNELRISRPLWPKPSFNFMGREVRLAIHSKVTVFTMPSSKKLEDATGYSAELNKEFQQRLNFTPVLVPTKGFGSLKSTGWNGMVGVLSRGEADIAPLDFTPSFARNAAIEFSMWYSTDSVEIMSKAPTKIIQPFLLLQIFAPIVWLVTVVMAMFTGTMLYLVGRMELLMEVSKKEYGLLRYITSVIQGHLYESTIYWSNGNAGRIISGAALMVGLIIGSLYIGSVTSFLAIPVTSRPINSAADLAAHETMIPTTKSNAIVYNFFQLQSEGTLNVIRERLVSYPSAEMGTWNFLQYVADGTFAFVDTFTTVVGKAQQFEFRGQDCKFHLARNPVKSDPDAFGYIRNSIVKEQINEILRRFRYGGILELVKQKYYFVPCGGAGEGLKPMTVTQTQGAIYVLLIGLGLSFFTFIIEVILRRCCYHAAEDKENMEI